MTLTYAAARLLRLLSREEMPLSCLLEDVPKYYATPETRIPCPDEQKAEVVAGIVKERGYEVIDVDGARVISPEDGPGAGLQYPARLGGQMRAKIKERL